MIRPNRRELLCGALCMGAVMTAGQESKAAESEIRYDFTIPLQGWETVTGKWDVERMQDAAEGLALVQRATNNAFGVIVAPAGPFQDVEVSVRFKPMSGREDASGGILFRFDSGRYYVIRANALEDNFRLYYYDQGRREIASARVKAPPLGQWHKLRITAEDDRIRGWLNDQPLLDHKDTRYRSGKIGLWTKADSVTAFDSLAIKPLSR